MKVLTIAATLLASTMTVSNASAAEFVAADNSIATQLCMAVASDKPLKIHLSLRDTHLNRNVLRNELYCNDMSVGQFASTYNLEKTAKYLRISLEGSTKIRDLAQNNNAEEPIMIYGSK